MRKLLTSVLLAMALVSVDSPAQAADYWFCKDLPYEKPIVSAVNGKIWVDNRCNEESGLVIVYKMYQNSSETFWAQPDTTTSDWTLHSGEIRVWIRFTDSVSFSYKRQMKYT